MKRFEYMAIDVQFEQIVNNPLYGEDTIGPGSRPGFVQIANKYAEQGWRLVTVVPEKNYDTPAVMIFERPAEPGLAPSEHV